MVVQPTGLRDPKHSVPQLVEQAAIALTSIPNDGLPAGRIRLAIDNWKQVTSDPFVLDSVLGYRIPMHSQVVQHRPPHSPQLSETEQIGLDEQLHNMANTGAIELVFQEESSACFLSSHFVTPKSDGRWRPVFNLKKLNEFVATSHFKMETLQDVRSLLPKDGFMAKLDLKDAFHSISVHPSSRRWLRFQWKSKVWQYTCLPFGLSDSPRIFTKILQPVASLLRSWGVRLIVYLDDWLFLGSSPEDVHAGTAAAVFLLEHLGFFINTTKSQLVPSQQIEFLGIEVDSLRMVYRYPDRKLSHLQHECRRLVNRGVVSLSELRCIVGKIQDSAKAIPYARAYCRGLQWLQNDLALSTNSGRTVDLTTDALNDLQWWINLSQPQCSKSISVAPPLMTVASDACNTGWGATVGNQMAGGPWRGPEVNRHINWKELKAAHFGLLTFLANVHHCSVRLEMDNTTAVAYVNHQGGTHSYPLCQLALLMWRWAESHHVHLVAVHVPGVQNITADWLSRTLAEDCSDWMLNREVFLQILDHHGPLQRDLFAARHNCQLPRYSSWHPDPEAEAVDALSMPGHLWNDGYLFPPFSLVAHCLAHVQRHQVRRAVLVAPAWPSQTFYPLLLEMLVHRPVPLPETQDLLLNPQGQVHPLWDRLHLAVWIISGKQQLCRAFQQTLPRCGWRHGDTRRMLPTSPHGRNGSAGVIAGALVPWARAL